MTDDEARAWVNANFDVPRETKLAEFADHIRHEAMAQNLISPSTLDSIWSRHIVDSAQLLAHAPEDGLWLDIGSGAGLPGLIIAILRPARIDLVEPRRLRTEFLEKVVDRLELNNVTVTTAKAERTSGIARVISARAVASLDQIFRIALHRSDSSTIWILPKGRNAHSEVEAVRHTWQGSFHVEPSITAPDSLIVLAQGVRPK